MYHPGSGEVAQHLGAHNALASGGLKCSPTPVRQLTPNCNPNLKGPNAIFKTLWALFKCAVTLRHTQLKINLARYNGTSLITALERQELEDL